MSAAPVSNDALQRILARVVASRFLTISILLHAIVVMVMGSMVLYHVTARPADFEAGGDGTLVEVNDRPEPPSLPSFTQQIGQQFTPEAPPLPSPLSAVLTATQLTPTWTVKMVPNVPLRGLSDTMKDALASLENRSGVSSAVGNAALGRAGGTRTAMIFGKRIAANKLGVILDVSGSTHKHLAVAVEEIQKGFSDAVLILYPGCGMKQFQGPSGHEMRKFSSIPRKEFDAGGNYFTTPAEVAKAMKVQEFASMTERPSVKETLFVSWYAEQPTGTQEKLIFRTQVAFEDLFKRGVDTIYWFADFVDAVDPRVTLPLGEELTARHIKLHVHNFAGTPINPEVTDLAEKSGGTVNSEKTK